MGKFEFTVPDGDYDYDFDEMKYTWKDLIFTEKRKMALETIKNYIDDGVEFTVRFIPKKQK